MECIIKADVGNLLLFINVKLRHRAGCVLRGNSLCDSIRKLHVIVAGEPRKREHFVYRVTIVFQDNNGSLSFLLFLSFATGEFFFPFVASLLPIIAFYIFVYFSVPSLISLSILCRLRCCYSISNIPTFCSTTSEGVRYQSRNDCVAGIAITINVSVNEGHAAVRVTAATNVNENAHVIFL